MMYVVVENLRFMLLSYEPKEPVYLGCKFKPHAKYGFMGGGADRIAFAVDESFGEVRLVEDRKSRLGYVLSREALDRLVNRAFPNPMTCPLLQGPEDINVGVCLAAVGVEGGDSRDEYGGWRFHHLATWYHVDPIPEHEGNIPEWFTNYTAYPHRRGLGCCSHTAVSFHYVKPEELYEYDYFIYKLRPYGVAPVFAGPERRR
ncbi:unnamed protein product [Darwinula stevensoni]|uniref:Uncharacterized protein n=1 Tax=Darwinula stevensoni TaxID=69355 RepID=A0A7R9FSM4_9CRUS|nr:unnamed protein product [Darwinula stevensoni]CAG0902939.1 unnamed protein product [Darwinula stevensoni]